MEKRKKNRMGHSRFPLFNIEKWKEGWHVFHSISQFFVLKKKKKKKKNPSYFLTSLSQYLKYIIGSNIFLSFKKKKILII